METCEFRLISCTHCAESVPANRMDVSLSTIHLVFYLMSLRFVQDHYEVCNEMEIECDEKGCGKTIKRKNVRLCT